MTLFQLAHQVRRPLRGRSERPGTGQRPPTGQRPRTAERRPPVGKVVSRGGGMTTGCDDLTSFLTR